MQELVGPNSKFLEQIFAKKAKLEVGILSLIWYIQFLASISKARKMFLGFIYQKMKGQISGFPS